MYSRFQWPTVRKHVLERDGHECVRCGASGAGVELHADHVKPLDADGAALDPDNLQTLCQECNTAKGAEHVDHRDRGALAGRGPHPGAAAARAAGRPRDALEGGIADDYPGVSVLEPGRFAADVEASPPEPEPPDELADYVVDPLERQELDALERIRDYVDRRIAYLEAERRRPVDPDEFEAADGVIMGDTVRVEGRGTYQTKWVPCGSGCDGCPHGPYVYLAYHDGDTTRTDTSGAAALAIS